MKARWLTLQDEHKAITVADVQKAAQRYLSTENYVQVVLKPEATTKVAGK